MAKLSSQRRPGIALLVVLLVFFVPPASSGYQQALNPEAIRDAFNLGRKNDQDTAAFLARYFRQYSTPDNGPCIASIEVLTPYSQLVTNAMLDMANENIYDVQRKYASRSGVVVVRVRVYSTPSYMLPWQEEAIWKDFPIQVSQENVLKPVKKTMNRVFPGPDAIGFDYADMELRFNAKDVASAPMTVEVSSPDGRRVQAEFDLAKLK